MIMKTVSLLIVLSYSTVILGITFSCDTQKAEKGSNVTCTCSTPNNIEWQLDDNVLSTCTITNICSPKPAGYIFQNDISQTDKNYGLTVQSFDFSNCADYSCTDTVTSEEKKIEISISDFDASSVVALEPGANTDGSINVTTGCVFPPEDISVKWYKVQNGQQEEITANIPNPVFDRATCTRTCNSNEDKILTNGFTHTEYTNTDSAKVKYRIIISIPLPNPRDVYTWTTSSEYLLKADCKCECVCKCGIFVGFSMTFGILGALGLLIIVVGIKKGHFEKKKTVLVSDGIGIACDVISLLLNIVVLAKKYCQENFEDSECCEEDCCKDWKYYAVIFLIVMNIAVGVTSVVIFVGVKSDRIKLDRKGNDGNATSTKSKKATSTRARDATSTRSPKVQSQPEPQESLSSRANSDGEVSRKDVHVQEPKLRKLPMPPIQTSETHDKKGRGLSATFDDNHPLESVEIPERRAGDLEPMPEETKKKKKRSKKAKETKVPDDDHEDKF